MCFCLFKQTYYLNRVNLAQFVLNVNVLSVFRNSSWKKRWDKTANISFTHASVQFRQYVCSNKLCFNSYEMCFGLR